MTALEQEAEKAVMNWAASSIKTAGAAKPGGLDLTLPRICAEAAARAYREATFESAFAHVLVIPATEAVPTIIAFRGSADVRAWLIDAEIRRVYTQFGRVHEGFWHSTQSVMDFLLKMDARYIPGPEIPPHPGPLPEERERRQQPSPIVVTGHSKGGAEAKICARLLAAAGRPVSAVVTFGAPRIGDAQWRAGYQSQTSNCASPIGNRLALGEITQRWVNEEDIVARLPAWLTGYRHAGREYFISAFGGVQINPPLLMLAASDLWGTFWGYKRGTIEQAADHPISRYQECLSKL